MGAFGFSTSSELKAAGHTARSLAAAVDAGRLHRIVRGWYCVPGTDAEAVRAVALGARLGCVSALRLHGAWLPPDVGVHLMLPAHASGRELAGPSADGRVVLHWCSAGVRTGAGHPVAPLELAVPQLLACQPAHFAVAVLDSLLHRRLIHPNRLTALIAAGPHRTRRLADELDPTSEEGIESIVRFRLRAAGIACRTQVRLGRDRVDLLVDDWLVIELDGRETHAQQAGFTRDRARSARLMRDGRVVLQFAYATVVYDWDFVLATIQAVLAQSAPVRRCRPHPCTVNSL